MSISMMSTRLSARLTAMALTLACSKSSSRSIFGNCPPGAASAASEAICAAAKRSMSHWRRKFETEGTNTSTSANMTKRMVSSSSLADRPGTQRGGRRVPPSALKDLSFKSKTDAHAELRAPRSTEAAQQANDATEPAPRQSGQIISIGHALRELREGGIRQHERGDVAELDVLGHRDHPKLDQLASFGADDGAAENGAIR